MAVGDVYKVSITAQGQGSFYMNTYAIYQKQASVTQADFETFAVACKELVRPLQSNSIVYRNWRAVQVRGGNVTPLASECRRVGGVVLEGNYATSQTGADSVGDPLPPQSSLVVTLGTGLIGRRYRGRSYHFGFNEPLQIAGSWISTLLNSFTTNATTFLGLYGSAGTSPLWTAGIWSERIATGCEPNPSGKGLINKEPPNLSAAFTPITGMTPRNVVFTQRRRTLGVGR